MYGTRYVAVIGAACYGFRGWRRSVAGPNTMRHIVLCVTLVAAWLNHSAVQAQAIEQNCGHPFDSPGRFGPFDYTDPVKKPELNLVEPHHFTSYMEEIALYGVASRNASQVEEAEGFGLVAGNLDYTLHAFPNHSKALYAMGMWQLRQRKERPLEAAGWVSGGKIYSAECYFERAVMFKPDDGMVHHAYGAFLQKAGKPKQAAAEYERAIALMPDFPEPHYNLGLLYVDSGNLTKAAEHADRAYALGYPLDGLKRKLAAAQRR
jgi:tetratricopeptide (TPR) repeat protein